MTGATYDWTSETLTVNVRIDGSFGHCKKIRVFNTGQPGIFVYKELGGFLKEYDIVPGQHVYSFKIKLSPPKPYQFTVYLGVYLVRPDGMADWKKDIEHRNNLMNFTYRR